LAKNCQVYQWPIILGSGFHTTYRGERVLVVITLDATFLLLKRYCKKICTSFLNDAESLKTYGCALWCNQIHGRRKDFSRHGQKCISGGGVKWQKFIYPLETKKTTFFAKNLIGKCQFSNSRDGKPPCRRTWSDYLYSLFFEHYNRILLCKWVLRRCSVCLMACACHNTFVLHLALTRVGLSVLLWM